MTGAGSGAVEVLRAGMLTTVQDWPGRLGLWHVGVPPSGPMDDRSFRAGNLALGNPEGAPGLECTVSGPKLRFSAATEICLCGADSALSLDGEPIEAWRPVAVPPGGVLDVGKANGRGLRVYILFAGGLQVDEYLGSAATFTLGRFGGFEGRALRKGDRLSLAERVGATQGPVADPPVLTHAWELEVAEGPHAAPDFFTDADIDAFYTADWSVHFNSARTGVRLTGPRPRWAREDGGEAGLHPSNIHDTPYGLGAVDYTGDVPVILGPDGPSLGGFVCPATVTVADRWKLGQLRPGDTVRFGPVRDGGLRSRIMAPADPADRDQGIIGGRAERPGAPAVVYRRTGDDNLLIEYGPMVLDLSLRLRIQALARAISGRRPAGLIDLTAGIRSLQLHFDPERLALRSALALAEEAERTLPDSGELTVESREVWLPLSWDDPSAREATERYMSGVRADAPWCPWNIEFIRRMNGLSSVEEVQRIVFAAEYLVLGLGDVYLGAPVATPVDPRHRLVTTKYNPARTWTPENAVGIGGAYLCVYGMEGPGGYQLVGRTVPVWRRSGVEPPWLLQKFDRIRWYPVSAEELIALRDDPDAAAAAVRVQAGSFSLADHQLFLAREAQSIADFAAGQSAAFRAEREQWARSGETQATAAPA